MHIQSLNPLPIAMAGRSSHRSAVLRVLLLILVALLLAACSSGPVKRVFPPNASVQELRLQADGRWELQLRIQNFSTVAMRFERLELDIELGGHAAGRIETTVADTVPPGSAENIVLQLMPSIEAAEALLSALETRRGVGYRISGSLGSSEPKNRNDSFEFSSALTPMPGLDGVLR
jgi:hypothetical protein